VTGLYNRRFLNESLPREIARAERDQVPLGVIMMDLDHFKRINDAYGHIKGDRALVALGELLNAKTRTSDIACRFGGEEFCLIMPGATATAVAERAEELRAAFERIEVQADDATFHVTISLGASIFPLHGSTGEELLTRADQALYMPGRAGTRRSALISIRRSDEFRTCGARAMHGIDGDVSGVQRIS
jgi:diguanylate cyclase (GGDEF)-like protein